MTGIEKKELEDEVARRRKPRTFSSLKPGFDNTVVPLDFCFWLHRNFDSLVRAINERRLATFVAW